MGTEGVDPAQVKMGFGSKMSGCCSIGNKGWLLSLLGFVFVILNLAALWALHFADRPSNSGSLRSATRFSTTTLGVTEGYTVAVGDAVSFNSDNILRAGAGTTAYLDKLELGTDLKGISYINFAPIGTTAAHYTTNVMSYLRTTAAGVTESVLTTISYDTGTKTLTTAETDTTNNVVTDKIRGLATLSDTSMAVLTLTSTYGASVTPAVLDGKTVKLVKANTKEIISSTSTCFLASLSSSSFVTAYYDTYVPAGYGQSVAVGSIGSDGSITLGAAKALGIKNTDGMNTQFGAPMALKSVGIVVPYYRTLNTYSPSTPAKTDADLTGLCVAYSAYSGTTITSFTDVCDSAYRPAHFPEPIALSDNTMAVVFHDKANSNALTLVTLKVVGSALKFQTSYVFAEVFGNFDYGKGYAFNTEPRLRLMSGNRLAVSFLNPALAGRLSVRILSYSTLTLAFTELTPVLPVALPGVSLTITETTNTAGSITHDLIPVSADGFVTSFVGGRNNIVHKRFIVLETLSKPVGVIQSYSTDGISIATQGRVDIKGLTSGEFHYATTSGALVAKGNSSATNSAEYMYAAGDTILVTSDSRVGVAADDDTLFVSTSL